MISPLHSEFQGFFWGMACLKRKSDIALFVTDCRDLTMMVATRDEWQVFQPELCDLKELRKPFPEFALVHRHRDHNGKVDLLARTARLRKSSFFFIDTRVSYWFIDTNHVFT